jgi:hypothetical protein
MNRLLHEIKRKPYGFMTMGFFMAGSIRGMS